MLHPLFLVQLSSSPHTPREETGSSAPSSLFFFFLPTHISSTQECSKLWAKKSFVCLPPSLHPNSLDRPSVRPTRDSAHLKPAGGRRRRRKRAKRKRGGGGEGGRKVGVEKLLGGKKCNGVIHRTMNLEGVGGKKRRKEGRKVE